MPYPLSEINLTAESFKNRILVVEDEAEIRELYAAILGFSGFAVDMVQDGQEGWEALRDHPYGMLITDNTMPRLSGMDLIRKVRSAGMTVPIILATGAPVPESELRQLCINNLMPKPFPIDTLLTAVRQFFK